MMKRQNYESYTQNVPFSDIRRGGGTNFNILKNADNAVRALTARKNGTITA